MLMNTNKRLYRSSTNKRIAGVCGGIAEYFSIDPVIIRVILVVVIVSGGAGILIYIILWIVLPYDYEIGAKPYFTTPPPNNEQQSSADRETNSSFTRNMSPIQKEENKSKTLQNIAGAILVGLGIIILTDNLADAGFAKFIAPILLIAGGVAIFLLSNKKDISL